MMKQSDWNESSEVTTEEVLDTNSLSLEDEILSSFTKISKELRAVHEGNFDEKRAIRAAALALKIQMDLAELLPEVEAQAKGQKNDLEIVESEVYFDQSIRPGDKKPSEAALKHLVTKADQTKIAHLKMVESEKKSKRWNIVLGTVREAHIFFRTLAKLDL